jgi:hypothetical protein
MESQNEPHEAEEEQRSIIEPEEKKEEAVNPPKDFSVSSQNAEKKEGKFFEACFCGCCMLGSVQTEFIREKPFNWMEKSEFCQECKVGWSGCKSSCAFCLLAAVGWPLSPCFSCYLLRERWKLKLFYPYDDRLSSLSTCQDYCYYFCCWEKNLYEQTDFIHQLHKEGNLTFAWDYALYRDHLPKNKNVQHESNTIAVFGPSTPLKQDFLRKFLLQTKNKEMVELHKQYPDLNDINHIQTGMRSICTEENKIQFLEVWDIPMDHFYSNFITYLKESVFLSIYIFDLNDYSNFTEMKRIFHHYDFLMNKPRMILLLKDNPMTVATQTMSAPRHSVHNIFSASTNSSSQENLLAPPVLSAHERISLEAETLTWAKRQGVVWYHLPVYDEKSYTTLNKQILKLLPKTNTNTGNSTAQDSSHRQAPAPAIPGGNSPRAVGPAIIPGAATVEGPVENRSRHNSTSITGRIVDV